MVNRLGHVLVDHQIPFSSITVNIPMWVLIPLIAFIICWIIIDGLRFSRRQSFLIAAALWGTAVFILNEFLSLFSAISFFPFLIGWSLILAGLCYVAYPDRRKLIGHGLLMGASLRRGWEWPLTEKLLIAALVGIAAIKGFSAV